MVQEDQKIITQLDAFRIELEKEAATTRKMLSRVPFTDPDWKPHVRSMSIKTLATHIAELPTWIGMTLHTHELDFAVTPYKPVDIKSSQELMAYFEKSLADGIRDLKNASEEVLDEPWTLRSGETIYLTEPKRDVIRQSISQIIHHRAQLGVFLRLLNIPIPGSYGPSADEN